MQNSDPRELLVAIAERLDRLGIHYLVTGGMAVFVWGRPRFTADIDIVVELKSGDVPRLEQALRELGEHGYFDPKMALEAIRDQGEFNFIDGITGVKIDFWILKNDAFDRSRLARRIPKIILEKSVFFTTPEDLILTKLQWYAKTHSSKQAEDIKSILAISGGFLDRDYIQMWVRKLELENVFKEIE